MRIYSHFQIEFKQLKLTASSSEWKCHFTWLFRQISICSLYSCNRRVINFQGPIHDSPSHAEPHTILNRKLLEDLWISFTAGKGKWKKCTGTPNYQSCTMRSHDSVQVIGDVSEENSRNQFDHHYYWMHVRVHLICHCVLLPQPAVQIFRVEVRWIAVSTWAMYVNRTFVYMLWFTGNISHIQEHGERTNETIQLCHFLRLNRIQFQFSAIISSWMIKW